MGRWSSKKSVNNRRSYGKSRSVIKYSHLFLSCLHFSYCYCLWTFISLFAVAIYELSLWNAVKWWLKTGFKQIKAMFCSIQEAIGRPWQGGSHVACLNFKMSRVGVYKCLSLIVSFAVTVAIWPREVVYCRDFILCAVATFWAMSLVGIYPGRASIGALILSPLCYVSTNSQLIMMYVTLQ